MDSNKKIARKYACLIWDDKDLSAIDALIHPKCVIHSLLGCFHGPGSMKKIVQAWLKGFPDLKVTNKAILADKDMVAIHWHAQGTHHGEFKDILPTGKAVIYEGVTLYRINDDKIIEYWAYLDMKHLLQQIT